MSSEEKPEVPNIKTLLLGTPGAPTPEKIEEWKTEFGEVYASAFSETEIFLFRPLFRGEYKTLQLEARKPREAEQGMTTHEYEEEVCKVVVLWPQVKDWSKLKAGTISSLYEQITQNSNFVPPQMASMLVAKL